MSQKAKNIFIKDGAGFIGSNLEDLLTQHHDVVIIDNLATGRRVNIEYLLDHLQVRRHSPSGS